MKNTNLADAKTNNAVLKKLRAVRPMSFRTALKRCAQHGFACDAAAVTDVMRFAMDAKFATKGKGWKNPNEVKCHAADPQNCRFHKTGKYAGQKDKDLFSVKKNGVYTAEDIQGFLKEQMEAAGFKVESLEAKLNAEKGCFEVSFKPGEGSDAEAMTGMVDDFVFDADGISLGLGEDNSGWEKGKDGVWKTAFETPESVDAMGGEEEGDEEEKDGESGAETAMKEDDLGEPKIDPATGLKIPSHKIVSGTKTLKDFFGDGDKGEGEKKAKLMKEQKEKLEEIEGQITVADNQLSGFEQIGFKADAADWTKKFNTMGEDLVMYLSDEAGGDHDKDKVHNTFVNEAVNNEYTEKIGWLEDHLDALASVKAVYDGAKNGLDGLSSKDKDNALKKMEDAANKYQELATKVVDDMYALQNALAATCEVTADKFGLGEMEKADWEHIGSMEWPELTDMMFGNNEGDGEGDGGDAERSPGDGGFTETDEANSMKEELVKEFNMVFPDAGEYMVKSVTASEDGSTMKVQVDYPDVGDDEKEEGIEIDYEDVDVYESMCGVMAGYGYGCEATDKKGNHYTYTFEKDEDILKFGEGENGGSAGGGASGGSGGGASSPDGSDANGAKKERKPLVCPMDPKGETKDLNIYVDEAKQLLDKAEKEGVDVNATELNGQHFGMPLKDWVSKNLKSMEVCHSALYSDDEIADFLKVGLTSMYKTAASNASSSMKIVEDELAKVKKSKAEQAQNEQASSAAPQGNASGAATGAAAPMSKKDKANVAKMLKSVAKSCDKGNAFKNKILDLGNGDVAVTNGKVLLQMPKDMAPETGLQTLDSSNSTKSMTGVKTFKDGIINAPAIGYIPNQKKVSDKLAKIYKSCLDKKIAPGDVTVAIDVQHYNGGNSGEKIIVKLPQAHQFFSAVDAFNPSVVSMNKGVLHFTDPNGKVFGATALSYGANGNYYVKGHSETYYTPNMVVDTNGKVMEANGAAKGSYGLRGGESLLGGGAGGSETGESEAASATPAQSTTSASPAPSAPMSAKELKNKIQYSPWDTYTVPTITNVVENGLNGQKGQTSIEVKYPEDSSFKEKTKMMDVIVAEMEKLGYKHEDDTMITSEGGHKVNTMSFTNPSSSASPAPASTPDSAPASTGGEGNAGSYAYAEKKIAGIKDPKMKSLWEKVLAKAKGGAASGAGAGGGGNAKTKVGGAKASNNSITSAPVPTVKEDKKIGDEIDKKFKKHKGLQGTHDV